MNNFNQLIVKSSPLGILEHMFDYVTHRIVM